MKIEHIEIVESLIKMLGDLRGCYNKRFLKGEYEFDRVDDGAEEVNRTVNQIVVDGF